MILRDDMLVAGTQTIVREQTINAEWALKKGDAQLKACLR